METMARIGAVKKRGDVLARKGEYEEGRADGVGDVVDGVSAGERFTFTVDPCTSPVTLAQWDKRLQWGLPPEER